MVEMLSEALLTAGV